MTHPNNNGWKRVATIAGGIVTVSAAAGIIASIILRLYVFPVVASAEALLTLEKEVKENYVTREILTLHLDPMKKQLEKQDQKMDLIIGLLGKIRRGE